MHHGFQNGIKYALFSVLTLISACSNWSYTPSKELNLKRYEITLTQNLQKNFNPHGPSLLIYPIEANNLYNSTRIAYSLNTYEISYYAQNEWADTPTNLLLPLLIADMENSKLFSAVVSSGSSAITDLALEAELLSLIQQYQGDSSKIVLRMRLQLVDLRKRSIIATDTLSVEEPAPSNDPYGAVVATNIATGKFLQALQQFISRAIQAK